MGLFSLDVGKTAEGIGKLAKDLRSALTGELSEEAQVKLVEIEQTAQNMQNQINIEEARSKKLFVAGWRPFIGWTCGFGIAYEFVIRPLLIWVMIMFDKNHFPPTLQTEQLFTLVTAMLGLGAYRTYEKKNKVNKHH